MTRWKYFQSTIYKSNNQRTIINNQQLVQLTTSN